jgi:hypothetical protein
MLAPRCGCLLDSGCGTGNFVRAWEAGYFASGVELDPAEASFATRYCPRGLIFAAAGIFPLAISQPGLRCGYIFEILEHQARA